MPSSLKTNEHRSSRRRKENDLFERLDKDEAFVRVRGSLRRIARPEAFVGRAPSQTREFIRDEVRPRLRRAKHLLGMKVEIWV